MNKKPNRYTPFQGKYKMRIDEFCERYHLDIKIVLRRMNMLYWEDYDSLVMPQELGDTTADKTRRALQMLDMNWSKEKIADRLELTVEMIDNIASMTPYMKNVFLSMKNYFFLDPKEIDLDQVFSC